MPLLVAQAGHVARSSGATGGPHEQVVARAVTALLPALMPSGWTVRIIGADEPGTAYRGDAFVSVHCDASSSPSAVGASVGYRNNQGRTIATRWKTAYRKHGWNRTFRGDNYTSGLAGYYGHRIAVAQGNVAACIVELGFTTNATERAILLGPGGRQAAARSIVEAVTGVPLSIGTTLTSAPTPPRPTSRQEEQLVEQLVRGLQEELNKAGYRDTDGRVLIVDGAWGPRTQAAYGRSLARPAAAGGGLTQPQADARYVRRGTTVKLP